MNNIKWSRQTAFITYIVYIPMCIYKTMFKEEVLDSRGSSGCMGGISEGKGRGRDGVNTVFVCEILK